ncbi:radical SAM/SPASM domain-containing protein [Nocardia gipuzkoensis]
MSSPSISRSLSGSTEVSAVTLTGERAILQLHPTRRCNLRCLHCYSQSGPDVDAATPLGLLQQVTRDAADLGYDVVSISGGEPLLYKQLQPLLHTAKCAGMRTTLTSNGLLLTERTLSKLVGLVDVLAISLDGVPATHNQMRSDDRAFSTLDSRMHAVRRSGIPFGFITTLTLHNVDEIEFVVRYARDQGAGLVQVHPLELEGAAVDNLIHSTPDSQESAFALVEGARLSALHSIPVQVDIARQTDLVRHPEYFLATAPVDINRLSSWLTPLVVETDGTVVPLAYGFPNEYALGNAAEQSLMAMAASWDPQPFLGVCQAAAQRLQGTGQLLFNWYEEVSAEARATAREPKQVT